MFKRFKKLKIWCTRYISPYKVHKYLDWKSTDKGLLPSERLAYFLSVDYPSNLLNCCYAGGSDQELWHFLVIEVDSYSYFFLRREYRKLPTEELRKYCNLDNRGDGVYYARGLTPEGYKLMKKQMETLKIVGRIEVDEDDSNDY